MCNEMQAINSLGDFPSIPFMASFQMNDFFGFGAGKIGGRLYPPRNQDMPGILVVHILLRINIYICIYTLEVNHHFKNGDLFWKMITPY